MGAVLRAPTEVSRNDVGHVLPPPLVGCVLLVDDMYDDLTLLAALLAPLEATIVVARSGEEALRMVDKQAVDLVVTDLNMPGMSGLDLARQLRGRLDAPAVIFLTGSERAADEVTAFELGAVAYLRKPVYIEYLTGLAREILRVRRGKRTHGATSGTH